MAPSAQAKAYVCDWRGRVYGPGTRPWARVSVAGALRNARIDPTIVASTCWPLPVCERATKAPRIPSAENMPLKQCVCRSHGFGMLRIHQHTHHATHALADGVVGRPFDVGTGRPRAGNRAANDLWIDIAQRFEIDAEFFCHTRTIIVDYDVGLFYQPVKDLFAFRRLQIHSHALFAAIVGPKIRL